MPRRAVVARELTKVHEEFVRGTLHELAERYRDEPPLGEVVVLVEGRTEVGAVDRGRGPAALEAGLARGERLKSLSTEIATTGRVDQRRGVPARAEAALVLRPGHGEHSEAAETEARRRTRGASSGGVPRGTSSSAATRLRVAARGSAAAAISMPRS